MKTHPPAPTPDAPGASPGRLRSTWPIVRGIIAAATFVMVFMFQTETSAVRIVGLALVLVGLAETIGTAGPGESRSRLGFVPHAVLIVIGAVLLFVPDLTLTTASRTAGVFLLALAIYHVVTALRSHHEDGGRAWVLASGMLEISIALLLILSPAIAVVTIGVAVAAAWVVAGTLALLRRLGRIELPAPPGEELRGVVMVVARRLGRTPFAPEDRSEIDRSLFFEGAERADDLRRFAVMLGLSTAIATFGLLQGSTAVVIGAMLVAPLMTPLLGLAAALVTGRPARALSSGGLVAAGAAGVIVLAAILSMVAPGVVDIASNPEIQARTSPNLLDLLVALAAGAAGAFATGDRKVAAALPGVAIAVALVPPLSVVGICIAAGLIPDAIGALLLFLTNFVAIVLSGAVTFVGVGYGRLDRMRTDATFARTWAATLAAAVILIAIPLGASGAAVVRASQELARATAATEAWLTRGPADAYEVVAVAVEGDLVRVHITAAEDPPSMAVLQGVMSTVLGRPMSVQVDVVDVGRLRAGPPSPSTLPASRPANPASSAP